MVSLKLAKELKELGYDIPTEHYYQDKDLPFSPNGFKKTKNGETLNHNQYESFIYSAPEVESAMLWVIEKLKKTEEELGKFKYFL